MSGEDFEMHALTSQGINLQTWSLCPCFNEEL